MGSEGVAGVKGGAWGGAGKTASGGTGAAGQRGLGEAASLRLSASRGETH